MRTATSLGAIILVSALAACSPPADAPQEAASTAAPEPAADPSGPYTFAVGDFVAVALPDAVLELPNDNKVLGVGRTPEEVASLLADAGLPTDRLELSVHPLLVKTGERVLLFDTGAGATMGSSGGSLPASMTAAGVDPADVTDIFISHAHGDHVGGLVSAAGDLGFPNAAIHISSPEWAALEAAAGSGDAWQAALVAAIGPAVAEFAPGEEIIPGVVKAVEIAGHTPGHSGYLVTSNQQSLLYIGDAMHHFVVSVQRPEWTIRFDGDPATAQASRSALLARAADSGQRIYAVHFPFPGVGRFERRDGGFAWVPE